MGADAAPQVEVEGALGAVRESDVEVVLVGAEERLRPLLDASGEQPGRDRIRVRHAPEVIEMGDAPSIAVKQKKQSSMRICFDLAKAGEVDAVVSAGNSGAMMACGLFVLGRLAGVERPAIVTTFPTKAGFCALLDMGANVDPRPTVLAQFAVLGSVYARLIHRKSRPRVGLLSNGSEEHKGNALTRDAQHLLARVGKDGPSDFDYVGYVEGRDIFEGGADVIVTDGFTGNVLLKGLEGLVDAVFSMMREEVERGGVVEKLGATLMRPVFRRFKRRTDYAETGGALLLGVEGVALICHGGSDAKAVKNAVLVAKSLAQLPLRQDLTRAIATHAYVWDTEPSSPKSSAGGLPS